MAARERWMQEPCKAGELTDEHGVEQIRQYVYCGMLDAAFDLLMANFRLIDRVWNGELLGHAPGGYPLDGYITWDENKEQWEQLLKQRVL